MSRALGAATRAAAPSVCAAVGRPFLLGSVRHKVNVSEPFTWDPEQHWKDPLFLEDQLTEDEIMIRGTCASGLSLRLKHDT